MVYLIQRSKNKKLNNKSDIYGFADNSDFDKNIGQIQNIQESEQKKRQSKIKLKNYKYMTQVSLFVKVTLAMLNRMDGFLNISTETFKRSAGLVDTIVEW